MPRRSRPLISCPSDLDAHPEFCRARVEAIGSTLGSSPTEFAATLWSVHAGIRVLCQLQCLRGEPRPRRRIDQAPEWIEVVLRVARKSPRIVGRVVPSARAASDIATAVGFAGDLYPKIGI